MLPQLQIIKETCISKEIILKALMLLQNSVSVKYDPAIATYYFNRKKYVSNEVTAERIGLYVTSLNGSTENYESMSLEQTIFLHITSFCEFGRSMLLPNVSENWLYMQSCFDLLP